VQFVIQIYSLYGFTTCWKKSGFLCTKSRMFTQQVTAGFFEVHSQSRPAFMAMPGDKPHWLLIHSFILMCDQQLHLRPVFPVHYWTYHRYE